MSASSPKQDAAAVSPRAQWLSILEEAAIEVFATMVEVTIQPSPSAGKRPQAQVTGMVGIAGPLSAIFSLRCSQISAITIASQMLKVSMEEAAAQKCDAVSEICNMVAGYFKAKIGLGDRCMLSIPTVLVGEDYQVRQTQQWSRIESCMLYEGEALWIALDIRA